MKALHLLTVFCLFLVLSACQAQDKSRPPLLDAAENPEDQADQIAEYIVEIFEDSRGDLWFGTMKKGAARYDGSALTYISSFDGLYSNTVASIIEDGEGHLWFGTHSGLSRYDGDTIINFTTNEGLPHHRISTLLIDRAGTFWVGTWGGVCTFDGKTFTDFPIPLPDVEDPPYRGTEGWVTEIMEDSKGNIWFGRDGFGACRFDPRAGEAVFTHFTTADGLPSNGVQAITEDHHGNIWFGSRVLEKDNPNPLHRTGEGGMARFDGQSIVQFRDQEGLSQNDIYTIYEDKAGHLWIGANGIGVYRFDGDSFHLYQGTDRMDLTWSVSAQSVLEDRNGTHWLGYSGGLFRLDGDRIVNVSVDGPWN